MNLIPSYTLVLVLICGAISMKSQVESFPIGFQFQQHAIEGVLKKDSACFLSVYPLMKESLPLASMHGEMSDSVKVYHDLAPFFLRNDMIDFRIEDVRVRLNLIYDFSAGRDFIDTVGYARGSKLYTNKRGLWLQVNVKNRAYIESGFYETQAFLPKYLWAMAQVDSLNIFPGFGRVKPYRTEGVDYNMAFSTFRVQASKHLTAALGYGKHKVGSGYRSLLWSDGMFAYPFVEFAWTKNKFRVMHVWNMLQNFKRLPLGDTPESLFEKKGGSFSVVSYHPNNRIELSIFESAFWNRYRNGVIQSPDWLYYSPVPMTGVSQFFSSRNSASIGLDVNFRITKKWLVYSQVGGMNLPNEKLGINYQFGLRGFNFIVPNLSVQVEWNQVDPFSYSLNNKTANAMHMNQNIGHPLENCSEKILRVQYRYGRWLVNGKLNLVDQLVQRPIIDGFENGKRQLSQWEIQASYWFNPKTNSQIFLQYADRIDKYEYSNSNFGYHSSWLSFGIRSNLHAIYQDF